MRKNVPYDVDLEFARMQDQYENEYRWRREFDKQWDEFTKRVDEGIDRTLKPELKKQVAKPSQRRHTSTSVRSNVSTQNTSTSMRVVKPEAEETKTEVVVTKPKAGAVKPKAGGTKTPTRPPKEPQRKIETLVDILKKQEPTPKWNPVMPDSSSRRSTEPKKVVTKPKGKVEKKDSTAVKPDTTRKVNASTKPVKKDTVVIKPKSEAERKYNPDGMDMAQRQTVYENKNKQADYSFKSTDDESWMSKEAEQLYKAGQKSNRSVRPVINKSSGLQSTFDKIKESADKIKNNETLKEAINVWSSDAPVDFKIKQSINGAKGVFAKHDIMQGEGTKDTKIKKLIPAKGEILKKREEDWSDVYSKEELADREQDTIRLGNGQFVLAQTKNISNMKFGFRNAPDRNAKDYGQILNSTQDIQNTEGAMLSTYSSFVPKKEALKNDMSDKPLGWGNKSARYSYIGIDKDGKISAGNLKDMPEESNVSRAWHRRYYGVATDEKGNVKTMPSSGNEYWARSPIGIYEDPDNPGTMMEEQFPSLSGKKGASHNLFGDRNTQNGGKVLVKTNHGYFFVTGSTDHMVSELERLRKNMKSGYLDIYELDPGSYILGYRKNDGTFTAAEQKAYWAQNTGGGHFVYPIIKSKKK